MGARRGDRRTRKAVLWCRPRVGANRGLESARRKTGWSGGISFNAAPGGFAVAGGGIEVGMTGGAARSSASSRRVSRSIARTASQDDSEVTSTERSSASGEPAANSWISGRLVAAPAVVEVRRGANVRLVGRNIESRPTRWRGRPRHRAMVAPTRSRPSLILNGICADLTDSAPDDSTGSTICRNLLSSVACPLSLARIAASKALGSRPATRAAFERHGAIAGQRPRERRRAAALARKRHLHRHPTGRHRERAIAQRRAIDVGQLQRAHSTQFRSRPAWRRYWRLLRRRQSCP